MQRVDLFPTHEYKGLKLRTGRPYPFGATVMGNAVNFSVYSRYATDCTLVLFHNHEPEPFVEIPFQKEFKMGNVFSMMVFDLDFEKRISNMVIGWTGRGIRRKVIVLIRRKS